MSADVVGRVYLAPKSRCARGTSELWVNFGGCAKGNQQFPAYEEALNPTCTHERYLELVQLLIDFFDEHGMEPAHQACTIIACVVAPCLCWPCCLYVNSRTRAIASKCEKLVAQRAAEWGKPIRFVVARRSDAIDGSREEIGIDQFGTPLTSSAGGGNYVAIWPPPGYNLVFTLEDSEEMRARWGRKKAVSQAWMDGSGSKVVAKGP